MSSRIKSQNKFIQILTLSIFLLGITIGTVLVQQKIINPKAAVIIPPNECGNGFVFCGGCVNGCKPNTHYCSYWIAQCSSTPAPTSRPAPTTSSTSRPAPTTSSTSCQNNETRCNSSSGISEICQNPTGNSGKWVFFENCESRGCNGTRCNKVKIKCNFANKKEPTDYDNTACVGKYVGDSCRIYDIQHGKSIGVCQRESSQSSGTGADTCICV